MTDERKHPSRAGLPCLVTLLLATLLHAEPVMADVTMALVSSSASCPTANVENGVITKTINSIAPCDLVITVNGTTPTTPNVHFREIVTNGSGVPWHDFHFLLGITTVDGEFQVSSDGDFVEFVHEDAIGNLPANKPIAITSIQHSFVLIAMDDLRGPDTLDFKTSHDLLPDGFVEFDFDLNLAAPNGGAVTFTLRQIPTVPEPSSLALLAIALAGLGFASRCRTSLGG